MYESKKVKGVNNNGLIIYNLPGNPTWTSCHRLCNCDLMHEVTWSLMQNGNECLHP